MDEAEDSTSTVSLLENTSRIGQVAWIRPWFTRHAPCPNTTLNKKEQNRIKPCTCHLTRILNAIPRKQKKHAFRFEIESWEFYFIILYIIIESLNHIYNKFILYFIFTLVSLFYSILFYSIFFITGSFRNLCAFDNSLKFLEFVSSKTLRLGLTLTLTHGTHWPCLGFWRIIADHKVLLDVATSANHQLVEQTSLRQHGAVVEPWPRPQINKLKSERYKITR